MAFMEPSADENAKLNQRIRQANIYLREARSRLTEAVALINSARNETYQMQGLQEGKVRSKLSESAQTATAVKGKSSDIPSVH